MARRRRRTPRYKAATPNAAPASRLPRRRAVLALIAAGFAALALAGAVAWVSVGEDGTGAEPAGDRSGQALSDFNVPLSSGEEFRLSAYSGRVVVLEFLAPGCPSCAAELAALSRVAEDFKGSGAVVLVLDVGGLPRDGVAGYYQGLGGGDALAYAPDEGLRVARQYGVRVLGATIVLDGDGRETYRDGEGTGEEALAAAVREAS